MDKWNKSTTDFANWVLKEETKMSTITATYPRGADYYTSTEKKVCLTKEEFNWVYKKIYD